MARVTSINDGGGMYDVSETRVSSCRWIAFADDGDCDDLLLIPVFGQLDPIVGVRKKNLVKVIHR